MSLICILLLHSKRIIDVAWTCHTCDEPCRRHALLELRWPSRALSLRHQPLLNTSLPFVAHIYILAFQLDACGRAAAFPFLSFPFLSLPAPMRIRPLHYAPRRRSATGHLKRFDTQHTTGEQRGKARNDPKRRPKQTPLHRPQASPNAAPASNSARD